jgi:hypothetical protein
MQPLPLTLNESELLQEHFAFELINPNKHRQFLESCFTEESDVQKAFNGWTFSNSSTGYNMTRVVKRVATGEYVCYIESKIVELSTSNWKVINGGRTMPPHLRDRGELTKAVADEGLYYWFKKFPYTVVEVEVQLPPNFDMSKRSTISPDNTSNYGGDGNYSRIVWTREAYLSSLGE